MPWRLLRRLKIFKRCLGKAKRVKRMKLAKAHLTRFKPVSSTYIELGGGYDTSLNISIAAGQGCRPAIGRGDCTGSEFDQASGLDHSFIGQYWRQCVCFRRTIKGYLQ